MPKGKAKPEIYLWLNMGMKPKDIIKLGYGYAMVYSYNKKLRDAKVRMAKVMLTAADNKPPAYKPSGFGIEPD